MILAQVFADAAALWRRDRDLWIRVAGMLFFVSALALQLFIPSPGTDTATTNEAAQAAVLAWLRGNGVYLAAYLLVQTYGYAVVLTLLLDRSGPTLGAAMVRALRRMPGFALSAVAMALALWVGLSLFIVPGVYLGGRILLTWPVLAAEPEQGPIGAMLTSVRRSRGRGWQLALAASSVTCGAYIVFIAIATAATLAQVPAGGVARLLFDVALSAAEAASALILALVQAAAYRVAGTARQGI